MKNKYLKPVVALILVGAMALGGTLAYITSESDVKTNKFVFAASDMENADTDTKVLQVQLTEVFKDADQKEIAEGTAATFMPGDELIKEATVTLPTNALADGAYVFIEVTDTDEADVLIYSVDETKWTSLGGNVYCYSNGAQTGISFSETVLKDNKVKVVDTYDSSTFDKATAENPFEIKIAAYAIQAKGFDSAADAWAKYRPSSSLVD